MSNPPTRSAPRRLLVLAALALIGFGVSVSLSQHFYEVRSGTTAFKSFCNLGKAMDCDAVAASPYAELPLGLPLSSFAAGWFVALFAVALIARDAYWRREGLRAALLLTGVGSLFSLAYLGIMAGVLHTFCLLCLVVDAVNLAGLAIVLSLKPEGISRHKPELSKWKTLGGLTAASLLVTVLILKSSQAPGVPAVEVEEIVSSNLNSPTVAVNSGPEFPSIGAPAGAPVTIVEFSDFQCPYCRLGALNLHSVVKQNPGVVRVVFRNFPLDMSCNRKVEHRMHPYACEAAKTAACAHKQGRFEAVYESLFEHQATLAPGRVPALAKEAGADEQELATCVSSSDADAMVSRDVEEGITLGIQSTPTFFINGHRVEGVLPPSVWNAMIKRVLAGASK